MTYLAARRQSELQRVDEGKAAVAAAAAKARLGWAKAGGEYQAHPDIANQGRRKNVEGNTHAHKHTRARAHTLAYTGIGCRLSSLEEAVGDLKITLLGFNQFQKATIPYEKLMDIWAEFDSIAGSLDQRFFNTFAELDLLSPAALDLAQEVEASRKKRRAGDEDVVAPGSGSATPLQSRAGACHCRKAPFCQFRCPCAKAGQKCSPKCVCGDNCAAVFDFSD